MDVTALLLSRIQFAFTISFHIIFPAFTIGLAAWLTVLEALHLVTGRPAYRGLFEFWLKIFGVAFGFGVVSGIAMAFHFGTDRRVLRRRNRRVVPAAAAISRRGSHHASHGPVAGRGARPGPNLVRPLLRRLRP